MDWLMCALRTLASSGDVGQSSISDVSIFPQKSNHRGEADHERNQLEIGPASGATGNRFSSGG
ncbi:MAG: hypothetical protein ACLPKH_03905, partial [Rhodomicrobium sp.]